MCFGFFNVVFMDKNKVTLSSDESSNKPKLYIMLYVPQKSSLYFYFCKSLCQNYDDYDVDLVVIV